MSTVFIQFSTQSPDDGQGGYGQVQLNLTIGGVVYPMTLTLDTITSYGRFTAAVWEGEAGFSDAQQAANYAFAINRDFSKLGSSAPVPGGVLRNNISANGGSAGIVVITAERGTFSGGSYTGNVLSSVEFTYGNVQQPAPVRFTFVATGVGTCTTEQFEVRTATGGVAPYQLRSGNTTLVSGWDGDSVVSFNLLRALVYRTQLIDSTGELILERTINPSKNIRSSDFSAEVIPLAGFSDIRVSTQVSRQGTGPLEYNLINSSLAESGWQESNIFGGQGAGTYTVEVRDVYECEVSLKVIVTASENPSALSRPDYFSASEFNSFSFFNEVGHDTDTRKNYNNTGSWQERVNLPKNGMFYFPTTGVRAAQFRSSYPAHNINLHRFGQAPLDLPFFLIQENLGITERVDCELFPLTEFFTEISGTTSTAGVPNGMGVYFDGGNSYVPNTVATVVGDSPYASGLPSWAKVGNFVRFETLGTLEILETDLFDENRGVYYFRVDASVAAGSNIAQITYDRHPYNVYKFIVGLAEVSDKGAFLRILPGVSDDGVLVPNVNAIHRSEWFKTESDLSKFLKIKWSAFRNLGEMSFTDGTECEMWVKGRVRPFSETDSDTGDSDDKTVSINQDAFLRMRASIPLMSIRQWRKLDLVGSIGNRGVVTIEDMELIRIGSSEQEEQGETNLSNITVELAFSAERPSISQEDPIYSLDTGLVVVPPSGGITGKSGPIKWQVNGNRLLDDDGNFILVTVAGNETYIEIP